VNERERPAGGEEVDVDERVRRLERRGGIDPGKRGGIAKVGAVPEHRGRLCQAQRLL